MKNQNFLLIILFIFINGLVQAQFKHDYTWIVGFNSGSGHPLHGNPILDFNNNNTDITKEYYPIDYDFTNGTMSDENGNMIFSTNGCFIVDKNFELMENGDTLNPGGNGFRGNSCGILGAYTIPRAMLILPRPGHSNQYILIHVAGDFNNTPPYITYGRLLYSVVDMSENGGLGKVIEKNMLVYEDACQGGDFTAVKHTNGTDWWVLAAKTASNEYFKFLVTETGVELINMQALGAAILAQNDSGGQGAISPDGKMYARITPSRQVFLFDFDRNTAELSNYRELTASDSSFTVAGLSFSPNSRFLYASTREHLWQFDLWASDIQDSKVLIDEYDGFTQFGLQVTFWHMQQGPDCHIYMIPSNGTQYMHLIRNPDEKGLACNFEQRGIKLPALNSFSIPNIPNYRLDTGFPVCDSNIVITASPMIFHAEEVVKIYPNPVSDILRVELFEPFRKAGEMILYNQTGQAVRFFELERGEAEFQFSVSELVSGMYFYRISESGTLRKSGKIIVQK